MARGAGRRDHGRREGGDADPRATAGVEPFDRGGGFAGAVVAAQCVEVRFRRHGVCRMIARERERPREERDYIY